MNRLRRLFRCGRGSVAVEFALFLPVFLLITFSIIELGSAWFQKQMLISASREGARLGAIYSVNDGGVTALEIETQVEQFLSQSGFPGTPQVQVSGVDGGTGDEVTVNVTANYNFPVLSALVGAVPTSVLLSATTVMRHE